MANIAFKRGLAANLPLNSGGIDGAFYFTTDTHKLYLKDPSQAPLIDLTHFINYVDSINNLPANAEVGSWYYITGTNNSGDSVATGTNILAYKTATGWVQVNSDTVLDATSSELLATSAITSGVQISSDILDSRGHETSGSIQLIGGRNVTISSESAGIITIEAENDTTDHKYSLSTVTGETNKGRIKLEEKLGDSVTSSYYADIVGSGAATVTSNASGITIAVPEYNVSTELSFSSAGVLTVESELTTGTATNVSVTPTVTYGHATGSAGVPVASGAATSTANFNSSGVLNLDVYTAGQVDDIIEHYMNAADAMTYLGTISDATELAAKTQQPGSKTGTFAGNVGDTYKIAETFGQYHAGDLLIATGEDGAVTYEVVKSGDSQVLSPDITTSGFALADGVSTHNVININLLGSTGTSRANINVSGVVSTGSSSGDTGTYTFSHGDPGTGVAVTTASADSGSTMSAATSAGSATITIPVVTGISYDGAGHVTTASAKNYVITDTHNKLTSADIDTTAISSAEAVASFEFTDSDNNTPITSRLGFVTSSGSAVQYSTSSVTISGTTAPAISIDFVWGTF